MLTPINTGYNTKGTSFTAMLMTDQKSNDDVILPMGSIVRGDIKEITPAKGYQKALFYILTLIM